MRVSIVIDNYNYEALVAQAIESALAQTYADLEVIVIDDGSRDGSMAVIRRYADRVQVIDKPNGGQASAYNASFARSTGELVLFLDADDWLYPDAVQRIVDAWQPGVSKVQFRLDMVDAHGQPLGRQLPRELHDGEAAAHLMREFGAYGSPPGSGNAYARSFLHRVLPMEEAPWRIGADSIPILLAPAHGRVVSVDAALGAYRVHRPASDGALIFNNSPSGLTAEYERIAAGKRAVLAGLQHTDIAAAQPLWLAPWEARTLVLCRRFGDRALRQRLGRRPDGRLGFVLRSIWRWPQGSLRQRLLLTGWVLAVELLPLPWALRIGRLHRRSAGLPTAAAALG